MTAYDHPWSLQTPWYGIERSAQPPASLAGLALHRHPLLQKYESSDFVTSLLADPSRSIIFDGVDDVWGHTIAVPWTTRSARSGGGGKNKLLTHRLIPTTLRKLYQPSHNRYYAITIELFCDEPGFPRPTPATTRGLEIGFVVRRVVRTIAGDAVDDAREAARAITQAQISDEPFNLSEAKLNDDEWTTVAVTTARGATAAVRYTEHTEAWIPGAAGRGWWSPVPREDALADGELLLPMWPVPAAADACVERSLWFGLVPTVSSDVQVHADASHVLSSDERERTGTPKLDDLSTYEIHCVVRVSPPRGHEHCETHVYRSSPTEPFRIAAFFDPQGTKNQMLHVKMPDLRALAAQAVSAGGVRFETPPGSMLTANGDVPGTANKVNDSTENCSFAVQLFTIVAMFLFSLFLPIVTFLFQLWWLLLLRFCWPSNRDALAQLTAWFKPPAPPLPAPHDTLEFKATNPEAFPPPGELYDQLKAVTKVAASDAAVANTPAPQPPAPGVSQNAVDDPLCRRTTR